jgi:hypothetical protein
MDLKQRFTALKQGLTIMYRSTGLSTNFVVQTQSMIIMYFEHRKIEMIN